MNARRWLAAMAMGAAAMAVASSGLAADMRLSPPEGEWALRFDAPAEVVGKGSGDANGYAWAGTAGPTGIMFRIEAPHCAGALSAAAQYDCVKAELRRTLPAADYASERGFTLPSGAVFVHWSSGVAANAAVAPAFNAEVLFVRDGQWVSLVATVPAASPADIRRTLALAESAALVARAASPVEGPPTTPPMATAATRLDVPGQDWGIRFDAPAFHKIDEKDAPEQYKLSGNQGLFNISFFVEAPRCTGRDDATQAAGCYLQEFRRYIVPGTLKGEKLRDSSVFLTYESEAFLGGRYMHTANANLLFSHGGKWGDLHASFVHASEDDLDVLRRIGASFAIVGKDDRP